jgi:two-component system response regulator YesN
MLATTQFVSDLGGNASQIIPPVYNDDAFLASLQTIDQMRAEINKLFSLAIAFRDSQASSDRASIILQAKKYITAHYHDSNLSLNEVAAQVNFSPNHFSAVFSDETSETFRDYLTRARIEQAKKLLRVTKLKCSQVAFQCGYNDPHYFSIIFRKNCGMTPQQFRASARK